MLILGLGPIGRVANSRAEAFISAECAAEPTGIGERLFVFIATE